VLLRAGVALAVLVVLTGAVLYLTHFGQEPANYRSFHGETQKLLSVSGTVQAALGGEPAAIIQFGLLVLIATPIARVIFSIFAFAAERDWLYVAITLIVLAILLASLLGLVRAK
jgi:uncharacterized membrane protein